MRLAGPAPWAPRPPKLPPSRCTPFCPTVSGCCAAQKYNEKAEKDKARYASEMKKCVYFCFSLLCLCRVAAPAAHTVCLAAMPALVVVTRHPARRRLEPDTLSVGRREPVAAAVQPLVYAGA